MRNVDKSFGVVLHEGKLLLMFRRNHGKEYFTFPGGGIDAGETPLQAVVRELQEETSVVVTPTQELYVVHRDNSVYEHYILCTHVSGEPMLGDFNEKQAMLDDPGQYYEPMWVAVASLREHVVYPLEVRDLVIEDLQNGWPEKVQNISIDSATARQEL